MKYDFCGWATKNNLKCSDGKIVGKNAFQVNDGDTVPLVYNHDHSDINGIIGHALLKNRDEGVFAYCSLNETQSGKTAKEILKHGDVTSLSICANQVYQEGNVIKHGVIREVSLVLAGANPGAFIESVVCHNEPMDSFEEEGIFYTGEPITLYHAEGGKEEKDPEENVPQPKQKSDDAEETVSDVLDTLSDKQKAAVGVLIGSLTDGNEEEKGEDDGKEKGMKHSIFDHERNKEEQGKTITHSDLKVIFNDAKKCGSLREAIYQHMENGVLVHASLPKDGFDKPSDVPTPTYGINGIDMLFPDYKSLTNEPVLISRKMDWVSEVINGVHRLPFARVKNVFADITEDEARAKGYLKGKQKKDEVFSLLKRVTDPKTIYKKQKLDRDDILDIGDNLNVVSWLRAEMRLMLEEEIARAILIGDGRLSSSEDKISEEHIRPIASEADLLAVKIPVEVSSSATEEEIAKAIVRTVIKSRKAYRGKGSPTFFTNEDYVTDMLLLEDAIGNRQYKTEVELATALRATKITTVEPMEESKITISGTQYPLIGIVVNLDDYGVGTNRGGEINWFDDFDIDFNQQVYLAETRMSGALTKPFSALVYYLNKTA